MNAVSTIVEERRIDVAALAGLEFGEGTLPVSQNRANHSVAQAHITKLVHSILSLSFNHVYQRCREHEQDHFRYHGDGQPQRDIVNAGFHGFTCRRPISWVSPCVATKQTRSD